MANRTVFSVALMLLVVFGAVVSESDYDRNIEFTHPDYFAPTAELGDPAEISDSDNMDNDPDDPSSTAASSSLADLAKSLNQQSQSGQKLDPETEDLLQKVVTELKAQQLAIGADDKCERMLSHLTDIKHSMPRHIWLRYFKQYKELCQKETTDWQPKMSTKCMKILLQLRHKYKLKRSTHIWLWDQWKECVQKHVDDSKPWTVNRIKRQIRVHRRRLKELRRTVSRHLRGKYYRCKRRCRRHSAIPVQNGVPTRKEIRLCVKGCWHRIGKKYQQHLDHLNARALRHNSRWINRKKKKMLTRHEKRRMERRKRRQRRRELRKAKRAKMELESRKEKEIKRMLEKEKKANLEKKHEIEKLKEKYKLKKKEKKKKRREKKKRRKAERRERRRERRQKRKERKQKREIKRVRKTERKKRKKSHRKHKIKKRERKKRHHTKKKYRRKARHSRKKVVRAYKSFSRGRNVLSHRSGVSRHSLRKHRRW